ncbi:MAG TPA: tetratricopeptide repeat protein [Gemmatimonadaceae bacterium]|nr:tetratricopeptide repeat protein [Gemmatimonadaceae bacterium]
MRFVVLTAASLMLLPGAALTAQHDAHSHDSPTAHGLGKIDFPTSAGRAAHRQFERGVLYLHNFHYDEAAQAFREAQRLDPGDVMSYWGEAMTYTHPIWLEQDTAAARVVLNRLAPNKRRRLVKARTRRERMYLEAVETLYDFTLAKAARDSAYTRAMQRLHVAYPRDDEATLFYALALMGQGVRVDSTYLKAAQLAESVFRRKQDHPGAAHYMIHALDHPATATRGLDAARAYSGIAPDAVHALHMTSHIFVALGMWDEVVTANQRAQRANRGRYGHPTLWLLYGLVQQGRIKDAEQWLDSIARQTDDVRTTFRGAYSRLHLAAMTAAWVVDAEQWSSPWATLRVDSTGLGYSASDNDFMLGLAALRRGDRALADSMLARMKTRLARATSAGGNAFSSPQIASVQERTLRAYVLQSDGRSDDAIALLREAAALEESQPYAFGPPVTIKPPREALGEILIATGRPAEAVKELENALSRTPKRTRVLLSLARAHQALGEAADASRVYTELAAIWKHADPELPHLREVTRGAAGGRAAQ